MSCCEDLKTALDEAKSKISPDEVLISLNSDLNDELLAIKKDLLRERDNSILLKNNFDKFSNDIKIQNKNLGIALSEANDNVASRKKEIKEVKMELASLRKDAKLQNSLDIKHITDLNGELTIQKNRVIKKEIFLKSKIADFENLSVEKNDYIVKLKHLAKVFNGFSTFRKKRKITFKIYDDQSLDVQGVKPDEGDWFCLNHQSFHLKNNVCGVCEFYQLYPQLESNSAVKGSNPTGLDPEV